jgi:hypothetical protein
MKITAFRPESQIGSGPGIIARFDLELSPDVRLHHLQLSRTRIGMYRVFAANVRGTETVGACAHFAPEFAARVVALALSELNGRAEAHGTSNATA